MAAFSAFQVKRSQHGQYTCAKGLRLQLGGISGLFVAGSASSGSVVFLTFTPPLPCLHSPPAVEVENSGGEGNA